MQCEFCQQSVFKQQQGSGPPVTIPGRGVAHKYCAEKDLTQRRVFKGLSLTQLAMGDLVELREMLLQELNHREGCTSCELF